MAKAEPKNSLPKGKAKPVAAKAPSPKKPPAVKQAAAKQVAPKAAKAKARRRRPRRPAPKPAPGQGARGEEGGGQGCEPAREEGGDAGTGQEGLAKKEPAKKAVQEGGARRRRCEAVKAEPVKKAPPRKSTVICPLSGFEVKPDRPGLSPRTTERLRVKLLDERLRHLAQADQLQAEAKQLAHDRDEGDTQFDEEGGEGDTISVERERDLMLSASAHQIVDDIDRALERIKTRTYGLCTPAGRRISVERLEALPYAETCVDCKARAERRR